MDQVSGLQTFENDKASAYREASINSSTASCPIANSAFECANLDQTLGFGVIIFTTSWVANGICPPITLQVFSRLAMLILVHPWDYTLEMAMHGDLLSIVSMTYPCSAVLRSSDLCE